MLKSGETKHVIAKLWFGPTAGAPPLFWTVIVVAVTPTTVKSGDWQTAISEGTNAMPLLLSWWASVAWPPAATPTKVSVFLRTLATPRAYHDPPRRPW